MKTREYLSFSKRTPIASSFLFCVLVTLAGCGQDMNFEKSPPSGSGAVGTTNGPDDPHVVDGYRFLGNCDVITGQPEASVWGRNGGVNSKSGGCTPPAGTLVTVMKINMDDGGNVAINGAQVYSVNYNCGIKTNTQNVQMAAGVYNTVDLVAINCGMGGAFADAHFAFYGI